MNKIFRQGDVLLVRVDTLPKGTKPAERDNGRIVLAYGEVTGHAHSVLESSATKRTLQLGNGIAEYLDAPIGCVMEHQEHAPIPLDPGVYQIVHQREYHPQELRRVAD